MISVVRFPFLIALTATLAAPCLALAETGAEVVIYYGYTDCIQLSNDHVTAVLCPAAGGRVLEYSLDGKNMLYLPPGNEGWRYSPDSKRGPMDAGRFDIGPEKTVRRGRILWMGPWKGEITGDRSARMTSEFDPTSGVRLVRDFQLDPTSSLLRCTQTIINESESPVSLCHWSRTFAIGGGIAVVPRSPRGRFPKGVVMYPNGKAITIDPKDPSIHVSDEAVVISAAPEFPKLGFDSHAGWLAYLAPNNQMFVKRFRTFPNRAYNEFAALTISVWYPDREMVELEPIGPAENLSPGQRASFTEEWWLLPQTFPQEFDQFNYAEIKNRVVKETRPLANDARDVASPEVHDDGRVTFRMVGQGASEVVVRIAKQTRRMELNEDGVWELTTEPLSPGLHDYTFEIDGVRVTDPRNRMLKKWLTCVSMVEVPGDPAPLTQQQEVAHGTTHHHIYRSSITSGSRKAIVYTPPEYDPHAKNPYPVVVLCHGFGDDETAWTEVGRAHHILDNLINSGRIAPMVVVMPHGHPIPLAQRTWSDDYGVRNSEAMVKDIVNDLLPLVEKFYHVTGDADQRAVVGLSMGGGQAIEAGMLHPETFSWVGAFSAATPQGDLQKEHPELLAQDAAAKNSRKLFWIACGVDDFLVERNRKFDILLNDLGISHTYVETEGAHSWEVWRVYLPDFLEQLFPDEKLNSNDRAN